MSFCELHCGYLFQIGIADEQFMEVEIIFFVFAPKAPENFEGVYRVRERKIVQIS